MHISIALPCFQKDRIAHGNKVGESIWAIDSLILLLKCGPAPFEVHEQKIYFLQMSYESLEYCITMKQSWYEQILVVSFQIFYP